jgi:hypothetical protein
MRQSVIELGATIHRDCAATRAADRLDKIHCFSCGQSNSPQDGF